MSLKKQTLVMIALAIKTSRDVGDAPTCNLVARNVGDALKALNSSFDRVDFLRACGVDDAVDKGKLLQTQQVTEGQTS